MDKSGYMWIGTNDGLTKFDGTNWTKYLSNTVGLCGNDIHSMTTDDWGNVWIATYYSGCLIIGTVIYHNYLVFIGRIFLS